MSTKEKDKVMKDVIEKTSEYFNTHENLIKENFSSFLEFIDLDFWNSEEEKESLWDLITDKQPDKKMQRIGTIRGLTNIIKQNNNTLFQPKKSLNSSINNFLSASNNPFIITDPIDLNEEQYYELYKILSMIQYDKDKVITHHLIKELIITNSFIKLDIETAINLLNEVIKQKESSINFRLYFNLMEVLFKKFLNKNNDIVNKNFAFTDNELEEPELKDYNYLINYLNLIKEHKESLFKIGSQLSHLMDKEDKETEFYFKFLNTSLNSIQVFIGESEYIYYKQKQKLELYNDRIKETLQLLKEEKINYENQVKLNDEIRDGTYKDSLQKLNDEISNVKITNINLCNDIHNLKEEITLKDEELFNNKNLINNLTQNNTDLKNKFNELKTEYDTLNRNYTELLEGINKKLINNNNNDTFDSVNVHSNPQSARSCQSEDINKITSKLKLTEEQKNLVNMYHEELVSFIVEKEKYCTSLEENNKKLLLNIDKLEKKKNEYETEINEKNKEIAQLIQKNNSLLNDNELINKDLEMYKNMDTAMDILLEDDKNSNLKYCMNERFSIINKFHKEEDKSNEKKKVQTNETKEVIEPKKIDFDFLGIKMQQEILCQLDDINYHGNSNLIFTERIKYLDEDKSFIDCILFITPLFFYIFNINSFDKCFSKSLVELCTVNASSNSNIISIIFLSGEILNFECFRILEFVNYFKALNNAEKATNYSINLSENNSILAGSIKNKKNYTICPYYGNAYLTGYLKKKETNIISTSYVERFVVLCDLGLIIMEEPLGKPIDIINLLFSERFDYNKNNQIYIEIVIGKKSYTFKVDNEYLKNKWMNAMEDWILASYNHKLIAI